MSGILPALSMADISINVRDPRGNRDFLILSHALNDYKTHLNDGTYWLTLEKRCLSLIHEIGYDLQTGVWLCLIETNIHGWDGLAHSSLLFAKFLAREKPSCWPSMDAGNMRSQIIEWYSNNVILATAKLDSNDLSIHSCTAMIESLRILLQQQIVLQSGKCFEFKLLLRSLELKENKSYTSSFDVKIKNIRKGKSDVYKIKNEQHGPLFKINKRKGIFSFTIPFIVGAAIVQGVYFIKKPEVAWGLEKLIPGNAVSSYILDGWACNNNNYNNDSWAKLKGELDDFENRITDIERKGGYLTISEIKTIIHQMQIDILKSEPTVLTQIEYIQSKIAKGERPDLVELRIAEDNIKSLNCQLARIHANLSY